MFVAWRDLRFAKGRFALMGSVVVLITLLVGLLSGLTAGLARENTSAVTGLNADHLAFAAPPDGRSVSFTDSVVKEDAWRSWAKRPGVSGAEPLGIRTLNAVADRGERTAAVSAFGIEPDGDLAPTGGAQIG
ncbi:ABC transporter permease, partial [Streptomyces sp. Wh19]|nr:ABC transporter permease [Streptomyces sp. Wh19]